MAQVSISEGARLAGVSRSTLNRHIKNGNISKNNDNAGRPYVDTSELLRFYGKLSQKDRTHQDTSEQRDTPLDQHDLELKFKISELEAALASEQSLRALEAERREKAEADKLEWQKQAERLTLILTDQRSVPSTNTSFWKRLFR